MVANSFLQPYDIPMTSQEDRSCRESKVGRTITIATLTIPMLGHRTPTNEGCWKNWLLMGILGLRCLRNIIYRLC